MFHIFFKSKEPKIYETLHWTHFIFIKERDYGVDSSVRRRNNRHSSGDIRAQFMADLRRLGGNIPHYRSERGSGDEPASSTTVSPPPHGMRLPPPPMIQLPSGEDSLPPRKRKVSQEHQVHKIIFVLYYKINIYILQKF